LIGYGGQMKLKGKIISWNDDKGFGFVEPKGGGERAFVHVKAFTSRSRRPVNGDQIIYELVYENNNQYKADNIKFTSQATNQSLKLQSNNTRHNKNENSVAGKFTFIFFLTLCLLVLFGVLPITVLGIYLLMSVLTFCFYAIDKSAAKNGRWRTAESTLHLLSLSGGWPGAYLAQKKLRHKSIKKTFQRVFWLTVWINILILIWLQTELGTHLLNDLIINRLNA